MAKIIKKKKPVKRKPRKDVRGLSYLERQFLKDLETESDIESEELADELDKLLEAEIEKELFTPAPKEKRVKAPAITYDKQGMKKLRNLIRKKDGTFYSKKYYEGLLKKIGNKSEDDFNDALILLRNKNPNIRYYIESKSYILYFQVGNFVDRLKGKKQTVKYNPDKKRKRSGSNVFTGELKKGTSISVTDLQGDETEFTSVIKANDVISEQNKIIDRVISILSPSEKSVKGKKKKEKKVKRKGTGIYVLIKETVTSNSEKEVVKISYNYYEYEVQGIDKYLFSQALEEVIG